MKEINDFLTAEEAKKLASLKTKKYRDKYNQFLIEGEHLIYEAINSGYTDAIEYVVLRNNYNNDAFLDNLEGYKILETGKRNFDKISETSNPQGIAALVRKKYSNNETDTDIIVALDNINDPGNAGTIIRTSYWFGVSNVLLSSNSVDLYNSKTVRASQGALFHLNIKEDSDLNAELETFRLKGYEIVVTCLESTELEIYPVEKGKKYVIVFGNEANGVSESIVKNKNFGKVSIKGFSECESINVAVSSGIILNHFRRKLT
jgi:RNA methyltransferase, TrmH family